MNQALIEAAKKGDLEGVKKALAAGADINFVDINNNVTPLHLAALYGQTATVEVLLKAGADISVKAPLGFTPLHLAALKGHTTTVEALVKAKADISVKIQPLGFTPLHLAAENGHTATAEALLRANADISAKAQDGGSPLHIAALNGHITTVETLLRANADINAKNQNGNTPLHLASMNGHTVTLKALLKAGSNIDAPCQGKPIVKWLEEQQRLICVPMLKAAEGLMAAAQDKTKNEGVDNLLQTLGTALNGTKENSGHTALHFAVNNNPELAAKLIRRGAAIDIKNHEGKTVYDVIHQAGNKYLENLIKLRDLNNRIDEGISSSAPKLSEKERGDVKRFVESSSSSSSNSSSSSSLVSSAPLMSTSSALVNTAPLVPVVNTQYPHKTLSELALEIFGYVNNSAQGALSLDNEPNAETPDAHQKKELAVELGVLVARNIILFPNLLHLAYNCLAKIKEEHPMFKQIQGLLFELLLAMDNRAYSLQEDKEGEVFLSLTNNIISPHSSSSSSSSLCGARDNFADSKGTREHELMLTTKIKHLISSDSDQLPCLGKLMADALGENGVSQGISGVTNNKPDSFFALFLYTKREKDKLKALSTTSAQQAGPNETDVKIKKRKNASSEVSSPKRFKPNQNK